MGTNSGATIDSCYNRGTVIVKGDVEYRYGGGIMASRAAATFITPTPFMPTR